MSNDLQGLLQIYCFVKFDTYEKLQVSDLTLLATNTESNVYAFEMAYEDNGVAKNEALILKTFTDDMYGKDRTLKERHALKNLHYRGYPVPRPLASETENGHIGMPFIIMERVLGRVLGDVLENVPEAEQHALLTPFVHLLVDLHTMNIKALVTNLLVKDEYTLIKRELYNMRALVAETPLTPVLDWLNANRDLVPCKRSSITHRDFQPDNAILTDDNKLCIVDWGWQISDARYDLGWLLTQLEHQGLTEMSEFVFEEYQRLNGEPVEHIGYFKVLASLRWLVGVNKDLQTDPALQNGSGAQARAILQPRVSRALDIIATSTGLTLPTADTLLNSIKRS